MIWCILVAFSTQVRLACLFIGTQLNTALFNIYWNDCYQEFLFHFIHKMQHHAMPLHYFKKHYTKLKEHSNNQKADWKLAEAETVHLQSDKEMINRHRKLM